MKGYHYQFDRSIIEILTAASGSLVTIEGVEDIDVDNASDLTAIQCKYYESKKYTESVLRSAVILMLDDFIRRRPSIAYRIFVYFGDFSNCPTTLGLAELKRILTYRHQDRQVVYYREKNISDSDLEEFSNRLSIVRGKSFLEQHQEVIRHLRERFVCSEWEADILYYSNALRYILDLAIRNDREERTIVVDDFLCLINSREALGTEWYLQLKGKDSYVRLMRQYIASTKALRSQRSKTLILGRKCWKGPDLVLPFAQFALRMADAYFRPGLHLYDAKPWTFVLDGDSHELAVEKKYLLQQSVKYCDGNEDVSFTVENFNAEPMIYRARARNGKANDRLGDVEFRLRLLSLKTYLEYIDQIDPPDTLVVTSDQDLTLFPRSSRTHLVSISHSLQLRDVIQLLGQDN